MDIPRVNGKNWLAKGLLQVILILVLIGYIVAERFIPKGGSSIQIVEEIQHAVNINSGRIVRLETLMESMRTIPENVASMKATVDGVKTTVDKIEKKLDTHIDK